PPTDASPPPRAETPSRGNSAHPAGAEAIALACERHRLESGGAGAIASGWGDGSAEAVLDREVLDAGHEVAGRVLDVADQLDVLELRAEPLLHRADLPASEVRAGAGVGAPARAGEPVSDAP